MAVLIIEHPAEVVAAWRKAGIMRPSIKYVFWLSEDDLWDISERIGDDGQ